MKLLDKKSAKAQGMKLYFTGIPCLRGHIAERRVGSGDCVVCDLERVKAWVAKNPERSKQIKTKHAKANAEEINKKSREWYAAHPEQAALTRKTYATKHAEEIKKKHLVWYEANKEKTVALNRLWQKNNPDKVSAINARSREKNREQRLARDRERQRNNRDKDNAKKARRIASKLQATPSWANQFFIREAYHLAKLRQRVCGGEWHVDHIVPLRGKVVCGLHVEHNLRVIPGKVNQAKGNRHWPDMPTLHRS